MAETPYDPYIPSGQRAPDTQGRSVTERLQEVGFTVYESDMAV